MAQDPNEKSNQANKSRSTQCDENDNESKSRSTQPRPNSDANANINQLTIMPDIAPYKASWSLYWELMDFQFSDMGRYLYNKMKKDMIYLNENENWKLGELKWKSTDDKKYKTELKPWFFDDHYNRFMEINFFSNELTNKKCIYCKKNVIYFNFGPMEFAHPQCHRTQWKKVGKPTH